MAATRKTWLPSPFSRRESEVEGRGFRFELFFHVLLAREFEFDFWRASSVVSEVSCRCSGWSSGGGGGGGHFGSTSSKLRPFIFALHLFLRSSSFAAPSKFRRRANQLFAGRYLGRLPAGSELLAEQTSQAELRSAQLAAKHLNMI